MKFYIVDAFTENLFGGNPAGVVILDEGQPFPSEETMVKTAAELRYSETAFISRTDASSFRLRYFTPAAEVDLCGHATIASFAALLDAGLVKDGCDYKACTLAGDLTISLQQGFVMMEMGTPQHLGSICRPEKLEQLYSVMGIPYEPVSVQVCGRQIVLEPAIISTGLPDIILPVKDQAVLASIAPDFPALSLLSEEYKVTGVHAFTPDPISSDVTARCRNFAPLYGINEEAATGTASGALTYYLYSCGLIGGVQECTFIQGEAMDRPSQILTRLHITGDKTFIQVGGNAAILAEGELFLKI